MNLTRISIGIAFVATVLATVAWSTPPPTVPEPVEEPQLQLGEPVAVAPQFSPDPSEGCAATESTRQIIGTIETFDAKGRTLFILNDGDVRWVISYDEESVFRDFENTEVLARGRRCDKQGDAVKAWHFDVRGLRVVLE